MTFYYNNIITTHPTVFHTIIALGPTAYAFEGYAMGLTNNTDTSFVRAFVHSYFLLHIHVFSLSFIKASDTTLHYTVH